MYKGHAIPNLVWNEGEERLSPLVDKVFINREQGELDSHGGSGEGVNPRDAGELMIWKFEFDMDRSMNR